MNGEPHSPKNHGLTAIITIAIIAALYFGKEVFLPLALAILISFLLAPLIRRLEKWHVGRIMSVITVTFLSFAVIGGLGYVVLTQVGDLVNKAPEYWPNVESKFKEWKAMDDSSFSKASKIFKKFNKEVAQLVEEPKSPKEGEEGELKTIPSTQPGATETSISQPAVPVAVVGQTESSWVWMRDTASMILTPLGSAAIVIVFVIFILLEREDLRDRIIHLVGRQRLTLTTHALDDAAKRVSRYLLAQLIVNVTYGIPVAVGLYFIGVPNAILWGLLAAVMRFIPYIGPWIAAAFPIALSFAVSPTWTAPMLTISMFVVLELVSNNVIEPWLYGTSTGLSPMAIILAAVFWTALWGAPGLLLATPLTVCLAVLGKHIPALAFLDVLLGETPPIAPGDRFYQRLLALDEEEAFEIVETHVAKNSLAQAYDEVMVPAVRHTEQDCREGSLDDERRRGIYAVLRRILANIDETPPLADNVAVQVICLPASSEADELVAIMLAHLLEKRSVLARVASSKSLASEMLEIAAESEALGVCISAVPPGSVMPAAYLCKRVRARLPKAHLVVGLWDEADLERRRERLKRVQADEIFGTLEKTATDISLHVGLTTETPSDSPATASEAPPSEADAALPAVPATA